MAENVQTPKSAHEYLEMNPFIEFFAAPGGEGERYAYIGETLFLSALESYSNLRTKAALVQAGFDLKKIEELREQIAAEIGFYSTPLLEAQLEQERMWCLKQYERVYKLLDSLRHYDTE